MTDSIDKARAWDAIAEKNAVIAILKTRLEQAERDRDSYKEQMLRAQIDLHAAKMAAAGDFDGF